MGSGTKYNNKKALKSVNHSKKVKAGTVLWILAAVFIVGLITWAIVADSMPRNYYLKEVRVLEASIAERSVEEGKHYLRLSLVSSSQSVYISPDDSWIEVKPEFDAKHGLGSQVGVLLGNYDVFKKRLGAAGQDYERNIWGIEDVYDSFAHAQQANPVKKFTGEAVLQKKKETKDGGRYMVLEKDGRTFTLKVETALFDKYRVGEKPRCEFESIGDLVKLVRII